MVQWQECVWPLFGTAVGKQTNKKPSDDAMFTYRIQVNKDSGWHVSLLEIPGSPQRTWRETEWSPSKTIVTVFMLVPPKNLQLRILTDRERFWVIHSILLLKNCWKKKKLPQSLSYKEAGVRLMNWSADFIMTHVFVDQACFKLYVRSQYSNGRFKLPFKYFAVKCVISFGSGWKAIPS